MSEKKTAKKMPSPPTTDWHRADIKAELEKKGWTLRSLSQHHSYRAGTLKTALDRRWPKGQQIIAAAIGVEPQDIWPSRYPPHSTEEAA